jgi:hypothetical protein
MALVLSSPLYVLHRLPAHMKLIVGLLGVLTLTIGPGCALSDCVDRTLVTGVWEGSFRRTGGLPGSSLGRGGSAEPGGHKDRRPVRRVRRPAGMRVATGYGGICKGSHAQRPPKQKAVRAPSRLRPGRPCRSLFPASEALSPRGPLTRPPGAVAR